MTQSKIKTRLLLFVMIIGLFFCYPLLAQVSSGLVENVTVTAQVDNDFGLEEAANETGVIDVGGKNPLAIIVARLVQGVLGIVGVVFLILIIWGGIMWMTSGGNEQRVTTAKKILTTATIGLVIIITGYAITFFIIENLTGAATSLPVQAPGPS